MSALGPQSIGTWGGMGNTVMGRRKTLKVTGDLTFLGVTKPVTLLGSVVGSVEKHPYLGKGVVGFSATGTVKRSDWGMIGTQAFLGDEVTIIFEGEFDQQ